MTILQLLEMAVSGRGLTSLVDLLRTAGHKAPSLTPQFDEWISTLESATDPANLMKLSMTVTTEVHDILKGKLDPRDHPSDAI